MMYQNYQIFRHSVPSNIFIYFRCSIYERKSQSHTEFFISLKKFRDASETCRRIRFLVIVHYSFIMAIDAQWSDSRSRDISWFKKLDESRQDLTAVISLLRDPAQDNRLSYLRSEKRHYDHGQNVQLNFFDEENSTCFFRSWIVTYATLKSITCIQQAVTFAATFVRFTRISPKHNNLRNKRICTTVRTL